MLTTRIKICGTTNLDDNAISGAIDLSRVANGLTDEVSGVVFLGAVAGGKIGRSVSGAADVDGDGVPDVTFGGNGEAWVVPGAGPKTVSTTTKTDKPKKVDTRGLSRTVGPSDGPRPRCCDRCT